MDVRKTGGRNELDALWAQLTILTYFALFGTQDDAGIGNGTTAGNLRTTASADYKINGITYTKASTDDLWDLSAETDTAAATFRAYWLYLDSSGTASFAAGADKASEADAKLNLPALDTSKSVIGVFIAGAATDFDAVGGLAAQGTIVDGIPAGVPGAPDAADIVALVPA